MTTASEQPAIDAGTGPLNEKATPQIQPYDFVRPTQISREHRAILDAVFGRFGRSLEGFLSSRLRTPVDVAVQSVEHMTLEGFAHTFSSPCVAFLYTTGCPQGGEGVIDVGTSVAYYLIDCLFGGSGESPQQERPLSELEQSVVRGVAERILMLLRDAWRGDLELAPEITQYASTAESLRAKHAEQEVLATRLGIQAGAFTGEASLCFPFSSLEPLIQARSSDKRTGGSGGDDGQARYRAAIEEELKRAHISLEARLPTLSLRARSLAGLSVGQVIQTGHHIESPIELHINGRCRYLGTLGQVRGHVGLQISETISARPGHNAGQTTRGRVL